MKFTSTVQDFGPLRSYTLPAAKWEIVRRALGYAGLDLAHIIGETFNEPPPHADVGTCDLPVLSRAVQAAYREAAKDYLNGFAPTEQEIQVGGLINDAWEVLAVGEDWATCRDTWAGEVAVWLPHEVAAYTPPKAPEHRLSGEPYEAEVICNAGHGFDLGDRVTVYPDDSGMPPCKVDGAGATQFLHHHQLRPL